MTRIALDASSARAGAAAAVDAGAAAIELPGCVRFDVLRSLEDENTLVIAEIWADASSGRDGAWREALDAATTAASARVERTRYVAVEPTDGSWVDTHARRWTASDASDVGGENVTHVRCDVAPGDEDAFALECAKNARASVREDGNLRFDAFRSVEDGTKFILSEVYETPDAAADHKNTEHYRAWRDAVAGMMATPRSAERYAIVFPPVRSAWKFDPGCEDECETVW